MLINDICVVLERNVVLTLLCRVIFLNKKKTLVIPPTHIIGFIAKTRILTLSTKDTNLRSWHEWRLVLMFLAMFLNTFIRHVLLLFLDLIMQMNYVRASSTASSFWNCVPTQKIIWCSWSRYAITISLKSVIFAVSGYKLTCKSSGTYINVCQRYFENCKRVVNSN